MQKYILNNGREIPVLGFGTWGLTGAKCKEAVILAIKEGYRHIDTASVYGNEKEVGEAINYCLQEGIVTREELFVTTMLNPHICIGYDETLAAFEKSLKILGLDYVDLYLLHYPNVTPDDSWKQLNAQSWKAMEELYEQGKVKSIGVSNFAIHHIKELLKTSKVKPVINQVHLSCYWQQEDLVAYCRDNDICCFGYQAVASLSNYDISLIKRIAAKYNKSIYQLVIKYILQKVGAGCLVMADRKEFLLENKDVFDFEIADADIAELNNLNSNPCWHITPDSAYIIFKLQEELSKKDLLKKSSFYLFNFLPIIEHKFCYENDVLKKSTSFLFGIIPLLKIKYKNNLKAKLYLFGLINIGKFKFKRELKKTTFIPQYERSKK